MCLDDFYSIHVTEMVLIKFNCIWSHGDNIYSYQLNVVESSTAAAKTNNQGLLLEMVHFLVRRAPSCSRCIKSVVYSHVTDQPQKHLPNITNSCD